MVNGIEKFKEKFESFKGKYTLIGGVACGLLMDDAGLDFRATQDFDIVLIIESMDDDFGRAIWDFIRDGGYKIREKSTGEPEFYRFKSPEDKSYPKEIELFSRKSKLLNYADEDRLTPIHISDEISSLSAILLDDEYYLFLSHGLTELEGIQVLNYTHIIPFKAKAWIDLKERKGNGEAVDSKNILKHKNDVFRLSQLLAESDFVTLSEGIKADMASFVAQMENEDVDLKNLRIRGNKKNILDLIARVYNLNS